MSLRRSLALSFAQKYSVLLVRLVSLALLSRLLGPAELGVFATAAAIAALGYVLADIGAGQVLIRERTLTRAVQRTALGVSLVTHVGAAAVVAAFGLAASEAMLDAALRRSVLILAAALAIHPFLTLGTALLQRDMRFGELCCQRRGRRRLRGRRAPASLERRGGGEPGLGYPGGERGDGGAADAPRAARPPFAGGLARAGAGWSASASSGPGSTV